MRGFMYHWRIYKVHDGWVIQGSTPRGATCFQRWFPTFEAARAAFAAGRTTP